MSPQTWILASVLTIMTVLFTVISISNKQLNAYGIIGLMIWCIQVLLICYDTECLVAGNCHIWSWIRTILYSIIPTIVIIFVLIAMVSKKSSDKNDKSKITPATFS